MTSLFNNHVNYTDSFSHLEVKLVDTILWITFNYPEMSNAFSLEMIDSLKKILGKANFDDEVKVVIFTGAGKVFCAGGNIHDMETKSGMFSGEPNALRENYIQGIQEIPRMMMNFHKPTIALVNGPAIGAGCDFTCMCDLRVGSKKAKFGETFSKLGLVPGDGGTFFVPRVIGLSKAFEMFLTGDIYSAEDAFKMGLLNFLYEEAELETKTKELALKISNNAPIALRMTKKALLQSFQSTMEQQLELLASYQGIAQRTNDHFIGVKALKEKSTPKFIGK